MKVKEIIVVEGKHDSDTLKKYLDCETIETSGTHLGHEVIKLIKQMQKTRGVIIFTDPDSPGEKIRQTINQQVPGCLNAFIERKLAHTTKKVGIEHASKVDIMNSLSNLMHYDEQYQVTLSKEAFIDLGLQGRDDSAARRFYLGSKLFIGKPNAKTLYKRLNMLQLTKADIEEYLKEYA